MGDDWRYDSWNNSLGWMDTYGSSALFKKVLDIANNKETKKEIAKQSEELDKLKALETAESLALLNSALSGEVDPVASLKLAQIEQDIQDTKARLEQAEFEQETGFQDTMDLIQAYMAHKHWKEDRDSDGWRFSEETSEE